MTRTAARLVLIALVAAAALACDDGPTGPDLDTEMRWVLEDECDDGFGLQARLFDFTFDRVYPSNTQVYFTDPGDAIDVTIQCPRGAQICYGATTDPESQFFWGVGLDGDEGCDDCCDTCDDVRVDFLLTCANKRLKTSAAGAAPAASTTPPPAG